MYHYHYFTDEETKAQSGKMTSQRSQKHISSRGEKRTQVPWLPLLCPVYHTMLLPVIIAAFVGDKHSGPHQAVW